MTYHEDFPMLLKKGDGLPHLLYFDTAATALKPKKVIDTLQEFYTHRYATVHRALYSLARISTEAYQEARKKIQAFLGAHYSEEIIFTRGATASLNLVARSFGKAFLKKDDVVLIPQVEHHSNIVPWQMICEEMGARLEMIPVNDKGEIDLEAFHALLNENVKLISLAHISNVTGTLNPIELIIKAAHSVGAKVCIDGAQSAPHIPVNVAALDADFYVFSGHKLYGPTGIGVLYGKKELLEKMPPIEGGGDMIDKVSFAKTTYAPLPLKFEAGTPIIAEAIGLGAAVDYLTKIGMETICALEQKLTRYALNSLTDIKGLRLIGEAKERGGIISFVIDGIHPLDVATLLDCQGIALRTGHHCSQPAMERFGVTSTLRLSFGLYNRLEEIDRFTESLHGILKILG